MLIITILKNDEGTDIESISENDDLEIEAEAVIHENNVRIVYPNGDIYEGEMKNGMMDGFTAFIPM